jgi:hypothetical protein
MCEFCSLPTKGDRDRNHSDFKGFFSTELIDAAVQQAKSDREKQQQDDDVDDDDDSDGT